jgi:uncharacterized protein
MSTFVLRLHPPRPGFALDATDVERAVMARHAAHWQPHIDTGRMVVFGPVLEEAGSYGLAVLEADGEAEVRQWLAEDPAVREGLVRVTVGTLDAGFVRPA